MKLSDVAELLLLAAVWGGSFLFMRIAAPVVGPVWLIEIRVLFAGLLLLPLAMRLHLLPIIWKHWLPMLVVGGVGSALPFVLLAYASVSLPAGFTSILNATTPLFGTVVAAAWFQEKLTPTSLVGFVLGFVGVVILVGWESGATASGFWFAVGACLLASSMYAIAAPYAKRSLSGVSSIAVTTGSQLGAALFLVPAIPFTVPREAFSVGVSLNVWIAVIALVVLSTAFAYILYFRLIQNIGATRALTVTYLIPVFAIIWGALALGEAITSSMVGGGLLVLMGVAIANGLNPRIFTEKK